MKYRKDGGNILINYIDLKSIFVAINYKSIHVFNPYL